MIPTSVSATGSKRSLAGSVFQIENELVPAVYLFPLREWPIAILFKIDQPGANRTIGDFECGATGNHHVRLIVDRDPVGDGRCVVHDYGSQNLLFFRGHNHGRGVFRHLGACLLDGFGHTAKAAVELGEILVADQV